MFSPLVGWPREDMMARSFTTLYNIPLKTGNPGVKSLRHASDLMADNSGRRLLSFLFYKEAQRGNDLLNFTACLSPQTGLPSISSLSQDPSGSSNVRAIPCCSFISHSCQGFSAPDIFTSHASLLPRELTICQHMGNP